MTLELLLSAVIGGAIFYWLTRWLTEQEIPARVVGVIAALIILGGGLALFHVR